MLTNNQNESNVHETLRNIFNSAKYVTGATIGFVCWGALIGWGVGASVAHYSSPCIDEHNDTSVSACSMSSPEAKYGAAYAVAASAGIAFFASALKAYSTTHREDLGFFDGLISGGSWGCR